MAFWSSQRIQIEQQWAIERDLPHQHCLTSERIRRGPKPDPLISKDDFKKSNVMHGAYELTLDESALITPDGSDNLQFPFSTNRAIRIPPGQFALLFSKETVNIPADVIAFISLKGNIKFKGLINISGFQVNPGFSGRLKFSVYNASGDDVHLNVGEPCFQIWFADLDDSTMDPYNKETGHYQNQCRFTPDDFDRMSEARHSPESLNKRLTEIERTVSMMFAVGTVVVFPIVIGFVIAIFDRWFKETPDKVSTGELILWIAPIVGFIVLVLNSILNGSLRKFVTKSERAMRDKDPL